MKEHRINARLPEALALHVYEECGESGQYDSASEYIRDLVRQDLKSKEQEKWKRLKSKLVEAANAPFEDFVEVDPEASIEEFKQRCKAKKETR